MFLVPRDLSAVLEKSLLVQAALIAQIIQGFELSQALRRANAVAALSCRGLDGQSMIPTTAELNSFLEANK